MNQHDTPRVRENYTMLCDFYELTMGNGYFKCGKRDTVTYFDVFFRRVPDGGGYAIAVGLDSVIEYIKSLNEIKASQIADEDAKEEPKSKKQ